METEIQNLSVSQTNPLVPPIEDSIVLPKSAAEAFPDLSPEQEIQMRANTIKLISDLTGQEIAPTEENIEEAKELARQMIENPTLRPDYSKYPNETMAFLAGMVAQTNCMLVDDLADLKMYVVNKLIMEVENAKEAKARISAISKLGEVDGVDAFKRRSEVTVKNQSIQEVEAELAKTLASIRGRIINAEFTEVKDENQ